MPRVCATLLLSMALLLVTSLSALAGPSDPLFLNITTDDPHRALMAISFGCNQQELGHPLTMFFNDKGVLVPAAANAATYTEQQRLIAAAIAKGATVLACPMCMKHYAIDPGKLVPGVQISNPTLTGGQLFKDNTQTLSW